MLTTFNLEQTRVLSSGSVAWAPSLVKLVHGSICESGHPVEDLTCSYCSSVRYVGSTCHHVSQPSVMRRRWDGLPLCVDCLSGHATTR